MQEIPGYYPLKPAGLPTEGSAPFEAVSVDFCRPYRVETQAKQRKGIHFVISLQLNQICPFWVAAKPNSRGVHQASQTGRCSARKGHPRKIYSDNWQTIAAGTKWFDVVNSDET